ncbi:uncharacterized protein [Elaeis guineensis]|uniref:Enhancer of polycomb-like protein n=1 Tax=Elaeis guineensis var. tenera TaxID=51953 RepID=A0A6I9QC21_ELAGV|nr:uncharacterized protein LOC105032482 [Elaeis guineensis]XP_010906300.1 uncharacterized protein LOC105032482 [Elaeis guineensis]XP_010907019.1 uncharacterized protein LOC105032482 [Elaeis guineensis]
MEDSVQKPGSSNASKKSKSLHLESIYADKSRHQTGKSRVNNWNSNTSQESKDSMRKRRSSWEHEGSIAVESRKKRSRKNVSLSNFVPVSERCQKDLNASRLKPNGLCGASLKEGDLSEHSAPRKDDDSRALNAGNLESSNCVGDTVAILKRPHGILGKTKYSDSSTRLKYATNDSICCANDQTSKLSINLKPPSYVPIDKKKKKKFHELVDNGSSTDRPDSSMKVESGNVVKITLRKARRRKRQSTIMENRTQVEARACLLKDETKFYDDFLDDDEENLEQNAARMLSSRFDPRCTSVLGNKMASVKATNGSSLQLSHKNFKGEGSQMVSVDAASRVLRPRKHIGKSLVRKRRHFYEVNSSDMDPYWVIKQRIRVYWPLDKTWYFGVVKNYDPITKMHHVKYDDRDEEWIDLHNERFKLLLFPSEVAGKLNPEKLGSVVKQKTEDEDRNDMDENSRASIMESEPIISWMARLTDAVKSSKHVIGKKQQRIHLPMDCGPSISLLPNACKSVNEPSMVSNKLSSNSTMPDWSTNEHINEVPPVLERRIGSDNRKISFVYIRKRFRKRVKGLDNALDNSASVGGPIGLLACVADNESALEELHNAVTTKELKQITWKSIFLLQGIHFHAFETKIISLCNADFLFHHGKLMHIWPTVHMEIVIVDSVQGLKILTFEGCLRWTVAIICLIMATINPQENCNRLPELQIPFTSVGFKLSGLHHERMQLLFVTYSFVELESSKWKFLENKLREECISMSKLPIQDCTHANVRSQLSISYHLPCAYAFEEPDTSKDFPERDCSDIMQRGVFRKSACLTIDLELCYRDDKCKMLKSNALCFSAQPSFSLNMHLKSLMDKNASSISFQKPSSTSSHDFPGNYDGLIGEGHSPIEDLSDQVSEVTLENLGSSSGQTATSSGWLNYGHSKVETDALSVSNDGDWMKSSQKLLKHDVDMTGNSVGCSDLGKNASNETGIQCQKFCQGAEKTCSSFPEDSSSPDQSDGAYTSCLNEGNAQTIFSQVEEQSYGSERQSVLSASKLVSEMNGDMTHSPNTTQRSIWHHNQHNLISPKFAPYSKLWPEDFVQNGFVNTTRKPRTQVSCSLQVGNYGFGLKNQGHHKNGHLCKKIETADGMHNGSEVPQAYLESLTCNANVLVTVGDRGQRECGAQVVLDSDGQKDWRIAVKFSGVTKYVHKANQFLQPGTSNRYTHAMMWKGGKDWALEFTNRSHWSLFKMMHEECYNRNLRAASIKNIPVPGVRLIKDGEEDVVEVPVIRSSNYHRQIGTEVEMALDPSHVLYDIDSDDEEWISKYKLHLDGNGSSKAEITDDMFERIMDMFEKIAYAKQCDIFTDDELVEFMVDFGTLDIIKAVYEHWHEKRQKKGLPLIRQFQPPMWEHYEQQVREWELAMNKIRSSLGGCQNKTCQVEKPPMFAFCLKPRGLEVPNKCLKQRSHKKLMFTGPHYSSTREKDGLHACGRKLNEFSVGGKKALISEPNHESSCSPRWHSSPSGYSPRDDARTGILTMSRDVPDRSQHPKLCRINSKKNRTLLPPRDSQMLPFSHIFSDYGEPRRNEVNRWSADVCEWPGMKQSQLNEFQRQQADTREFRLHDASSAAQHASNMAKLKREKAQWLLRKADLAVHKATFACMTAEAIKASQKDVIGDG